MQDYKNQLKDRGICVIIPVYNNEKTIRDVALRSLNFCMDVIVVNDGSTDSTGEILRATEGIILVEYPDNKNKGKGHALRCGFRKAQSLGFTYAITLDGDGQHFPEDIPLLLEANTQHPGAIIIGKRKDLENATRSKGSSFANKFANFWFMVQTLTKIDDTQSGYRLYPLQKLYGLSLISARYEAELELLVLPRWHGVKIATTEVNVYYPPKEERVSHFRPTADFARISVLNTILCILAIIYALPLAILRGIWRLVCKIFKK